MKAESKVLIQTQAGTRVVLNQRPTETHPMASVLESCFTLRLQRPQGKKRWIEKAKHDRVPLIVITEIFATIVADLGQ